MDANDLRTMLDYNVWARKRLLEAVTPLSAEQYAKPLGSSFGSVRDTVVHLYGAEWIWTARLEATPPPAAFPAAEAYPDLADVQEAWAANDVRLRAFAGTLDAASVQLMIEYRTMAGASMSSPVWQIIHHMTNHATYHRGQVTTLIRQLGGKPPKSQDLITFYRELGTAAA